MTIETIKNDIIEMENEDYENIKNGRRGVPNREISTNCCIGLDEDDISLYAKDFNHSLIILSR